jgi:lipoyl-dependent peroxiredoxin subunit D
MNLENLLEQIPEYAKDLKLNAKTIILDNQLLSKKQVAIIAIASAIATKNQQLKEATINQFTNDLDEKELSAAKAAAAIMAMNNIYYRFLDLIELEEYSKIPAGLRMNILGTHGIEKVDFELAALAVSAVNGCKYCVLAHERVLRKHGITAEQIHSTVKIAAILNGIAAVNL